MNYTASQGNVNPVINDTPAALNNLQSTIASRTSFDTPFFLMPVRLETRFMKVMRNLLDDVIREPAVNVLTGIKGTLTEIDKAISFTGFSGTVALNAAIALEQSILSIHTSLADGTALQPMEKAELNKQLDMLNTRLPKALLRLAQHDEGQLGNEVIPAINSAMQLVNDAARQKEDDPSWQDQVSQQASMIFEETLHVINLNQEPLSMFSSGNLSTDMINFMLANSRKVPDLLQNLGNDGSDYTLTAADQQLIWQGVQELATQLGKLSYYLAGVDAEPYKDQLRNLKTLNSDIIRIWSDFMLPGTAAPSWLTPVSNAGIPLTDEEQNSIPGEIRGLFFFLNDAQVILSDTVNAFVQGEEDERMALFSEFMNKLNEVADRLQVQAPLHQEPWQRFLWQALSPYNDILEQMHNALNREAENIPEDWQYQFSNTTNRLVDAWDNLGTNSANTVVLAGIADGDIPLTGEEYNLLPGEVIWLGNTLRETTLHVINGAQTIMDSGAFDPGAVQELCFRIDQVTDALNGSADGSQVEIRNDIERRFLWQQVRELPQQMTAIRAYFNNFNADNYDFAQQQIVKINVSLADLSAGWSKVLKVDAGTATLFSPWRQVDELWIRVYPDDIFIHTHEEALTQEEKDSGIAYWTAWWAAHGDKDKQLAAWRALVALYGPQRAAWIIKLLTPTNFNNVVVIGNVTATNAQINTLNTYTGQLMAISGNQTQFAGMTQHLSYYAPQLEHFNASLKGIEAIPADFSEILMQSVSVAQHDFSQLGNQVIARNGELAETVAGINNQFGILRTAVSRIRIIDSWDQIYGETPTFPTVTLKDENWTEAARTFVLPDRFVFAAINDKTDGSYTFQHIKVGATVPPVLQAGLHPDSTSFNLDAYSNLTLDPALKWMFDFNEAQSKGMGIIIRLTNAEAGSGFDRLLALGVKLNDTLPFVPTGYSSFEDYAKKNGKQLLERLLNNHHYAADGMSILTLGTATNNTDGSNAGFNEPDELCTDSFQTEAQNPLFNATGSKLNKKDGQWLADALGIDYAVMQHIRNADRKQVSGAIAMNRALWPATIGNSMSEMMNRLFTRDTIGRTKDYFTDYVLGRNTIPSLRIGNQPYGILPATAFGRWKWEKKFTGSQSDLDQLKEFGTSDTATYQSILGSGTAGLLEDRFNERLFKTLEKLNETWMKMVNWYVKTVDKNKGTASTQQDFMEILGSDALMAEAYSRFMTNSANFHSISQYYNGNGVAWSSINVPQELLTLFNNFALSGGNTGTVTGLYEDSTFTDQFPGNTTGLAKGIVNALPILNVDLLKYVSGNPSRGQYNINGPTVDEKPLSEDDTITPISGANYIQWLLSASLNDIWHNNAFGSMQSRSLLFLLLRQSILTTYRDTCWDTLVKKDLFSKGARSAIGNTAGIAAQILGNPLQLILTKWHLLFNSVRGVYNNPGLKDALTYFSENSVWWPGGGSPLAAGSLISDIPAGGGPDYRNVNLGAFLKNPQNTSGGAGLNYSSLYTNTDWSTINAVRDAFDHLKFLPSSDLDRMLREHIDLCSYRLDAWNYGMVNKRLWKNRNAESGIRKTGINLGAYGWLIDVRPKNQEGLKVINKAQHLPAGLTEGSDPVYYDKTNLGFIHTPSIAHALTAALLRSGYVSEAQNDDNRFAVNLSSERVKMALSLLEGIRNGQTMNALLGYMLERNLHERYSAGVELDKYIYKFRRQFMLGGAVPGNTPAETVRPNNVADGVELLHAFKNSIADYLKAYPSSSIYDLYNNTSLQVGGQPMSSRYPFGLADMPATPPAEMGLLITEIDRIANAIDALGDLTVAEGVFQVAKGNFSRSAAVMEALTEGKNPVDPEIIETPVTGTHLSHKLVTMVPVITGASPWTGIAMTPRALAEPSVNNWIAQSLAAAFPSGTLSSVADLPAHTGCAVSFRDSNGQPQEYPVLLSQLGLQPIDLVYLVQAGNYKEELAKRICYYTRGHATTYNGSTGIPVTVALKVEFRNRSSNPAIKASFSELLALLSAVSETVQNSRWLKAEDFVAIPNPQVATGTALYDVVSLQQRAVTLKNNFNTAVKSYFDSLPAVIGSQSDFNTLRNHLTAAADYGIDFGYPDAAWESFPATTPFPQEVVDLAATLLDTAKRVQTEVTRRYDEADGLIGSITGSTPEEEAVKILTDAIKAILGNGFKAIPAFSFGYYTGLKTAIDDQLFSNTTTNTTGIMRQYQPGNVASAMEDWLYGLARVQEKTADVETMRILAAEGNVHPLKDIRPVQFPYTAAAPGVTEDYWLGTEYPDTYTPPGDKLSVAVFNYNALAASGGYYAGLVLDEWNELIPGKEEVTGIAFHYDQPDAKPPQNVLLAVCPSVNGSWKLDDLWHTLLDTMDMAKIRMVEPDHFKADSSKAGSNQLEIFKWLLPAIVGEVTPHNVTRLANGSYQHNSYQGSESIQQVSFEYNPNNDVAPTPAVVNTGTTGTVGTGTATTSIGINWNDISADTLISNPTLQEFINTQYSLTEISLTQAQLAANISTTS